MAGSGDEGIKKKFFFDLKRLFISKKQQVEVEVDDNVGLTESKITENSSADSPSDDRDNMQRPVRPHAEDCSFFVRTGTCKFGTTCKFNHPILFKIMVDGEKSKGNGSGSTSKDLSQIPCKFYQTGSCKNGESCQFNHSGSEAEKSPRLELNALGYPKRSGKTDCSYYMRTGMCGFGVSCRFHHPEPIFVLESELYSSNFTGDPNQLYLSVPEMAPGSFMYMHQDCVVTGHQKCSEEPQCKQEKKSSSSSSSPSPSPSPSPPAANVEIIEDYPVDLPKREPCALNDVGLPIRPGKKVCWNYKNLGLCKLGRACLYDHPKKRLSTDGSTSESLLGVKAEDTHK